MSDRRNEGPLLALVFFVGIIVVLALILLAAIGPKPAQGGALILLGIGTAAAREAIADVLAGISRPRLPQWFVHAYSVVIGVIGLVVVGYGVARLI